MSVAKCYNRRLWLVKRMAGKLDAKAQRREGRGGLGLGGFTGFRYRPAWQVRGERKISPKIPLRLCAFAPLRSNFPPPQANDECGNIGASARRAH